uniref:PDZ and LIM domain 7 n=1 Tax=Cynoglossus semilaevis TaxID=244447 RepID=A0A3P8WDD4_CYNSE
MSNCMLCTVLHCLPLPRPHRTHLLRLLFNQSTPLPPARALTRWRGHLQQVVLVATQDPLLNLLPTRPNLAVRTHRAVLICSSHTMDGNSRQARPQDGERSLFYPQRSQQEAADPGHRGLAAPHWHHPVALLPHPGPAHRHRLHLEPTPSPARAQAADKPDGSKTAAVPSSSGPSCRPPWVTDPEFATRFRPDKTSTVITQHQQPVQPTPMQNRSSILQAAQQAPEDGSRTPVCGACNKIIRGRYLVALGRSWHPEEFTCSQCKVVLDEGGFFEERGAVFCTKCYDNRYAPNCAKCKKKITGEIMHALKMTYHVQCFKCAACKMPIRNQAFYMEEGEPYCERDYETMFGTKCHGCDFKIDAGDRFLEALGYSWHDTCFVCALCQINLEGKTFYSKKDKPLCKGHAFAPV